MPISEEAVLGVTAVVDNVLCRYRHNVSTRNVAFPIARYRKPDHYFNWIKEFRGFGSIKFGSSSDDFFKGRFID